MADELSDHDEEVSCSFAIIKINRNSARRCRVDLVSPISTVYQYQTLNLARFH